MFIGNQSSALSLLRSSIQKNPTSNKPRLRAAKYLLQSGQDPQSALRALTVPPGSAQDNLIAEEQAEKMRTELAAYLRLEETIKTGELTSRAVRLALWKEKDWAAVQGVTEWHY